MFLVQFPDFRLVDRLALVCFLGDQGRKVLLRGLFPLRNHLRMHILLLGQFGNRERSGKGLQDHKGYDLSREIPSFAIAPVLSVRGREQPWHTVQNLGTTSVVSSTP